VELLIDIGHSQLKAATFSDGKIRRVLEAPYLDNQSLHELLNVLDHYPTLTRVYVANVAEKSFNAVIAGYFQQFYAVSPVFVRSESNTLGVKNAYRSFQQLGVDRWLALVAVHQRIDGDVCIVGCGTAITIDVMRTSGEHLGGLIMPSAKLMQLGLNNYTTLPLLDTNISIPTLGTSTQTCMRIGTTLPIIATIEYVVNQVTVQHGLKTQCILTGGEVEQFANKLAIKFIHMPDLVFQGLSDIAGLRT